MTRTMSKIASRPRTRSRYSTRHVFLGVAAAFVSGGVLACQSRLNGELGRQWEDGTLAALWSFGSGLAVLALVVAVVPGVRAGVRKILRTIRTPTTAPANPSDANADANSDDDGDSGRRLRWWQCLGGVCGAFVVVTQSTTVGMVGVAVFTVALVAGLAGSSLVVDWLGVGPGGRQNVTANRLVGAALALGAVILAVSDEFGALSLLALAALPALAGIGTAWQQAVNGQVSVSATRATSCQPAGRGLHGALVAAFVNFTVGTTVLVVAGAIDIAARGVPDVLPTNPLLYVGGLCGVAFVTLAAVVVRITGVLLLGLGSVAGQLIAALLLDALTPTGDVHLSAATVVGTLLTLAAVVVAAVPRRLLRSGRVPG
jgi:bacterial/archaeal transporter family-2 protein